MVLCGSTSWGGWVRNSDAALQIPQETETEFWKGDELIRLRYSSTRRLKDRPAGVVHWLNTRASCFFSKSEWARTMNIDEVATNTSTSVFLKKGSSTVGMTHPEVYTQCMLWIIFQTGEIGSQGKRLRNPLTNYPGESLVLQRPVSANCLTETMAPSSHLIHEVTQDHTVSRTRHTKQCFEYMI